MLLLAISTLALMAGILAFQKPWLGVLTFVLFTPFDFPLSLGRAIVYVNELALLPVLAAGGIRLALSNRRRKIEFAEILWALPFLAAVGFSAWNAQHASAVLKQAARWLELVLGVWYTAHAVEDEKQFHILVRALLTFGAAMALFGILQTLAGPWAGMNAGKTFLIHKSTIMRSYATFGHPNQFAGYLNLLLPLAAMDYLRGRFPARSWPAGLAFLVLAVALIFTFSRGAWLAAFIAFSGMMLFTRLSQKLELAAILAAASVIAFFTLSAVVPKTPGYAAEFSQPIPAIAAAGNPVVNRLESLSSTDNSANSRKRFTLVALDMFSQHPWLGFGAGEYGIHIRNYLNERAYDWSAARAHIHNLYLQILIESGVFGLAGFLLLIFVYLAKPLRAACRFTGLPGLGWPLAFTASSVAFLIHNGFDVLTIHARGLHWAVIVGLGLAWTRFGPVTEWPTPNETALHRQAAEAN
jgi:O-antigen ligase